MHAIRTAVGAGMLVAAAALAVFVVRTDAGLEYDDAGYLTRGFYHAAQVSERGNLLLPRLVWSLGFESPKPPLYHGLLAVAALSFGRQHVDTVLVAGTMVPLIALAAAIFALARAAGGPRAGGLALAVYAAVPAALVLATRLLTETTLAAAVVAGCHFAFRRTRGGGLRDELAFGLCAGLALLSKLLAPLFLAPPAAIALLACWRAQGPRHAIRFGAVAAAVALLVAGPWYLRNGQAALAFARYARAHPSSLYPDPAWMRPLDLVRGSVGWPLMLLLVLLFVRQPAAEERASMLRRFALWTAGLSAVVIAAQPVFDARYWLPAAALLATCGGVELAAAWEGARQPLRPVLAATLTALVAGSVASLLATPRPRTPWNAAAVVTRFRPSHDSPPALCTLGNDPEWNLEKLRLAAELSALRPRPSATDLLLDGRMTDFEERLARCDVVFALRPDEVDRTPSQLALNADLAAASRRLAAHAEFTADRDAAAALGARANVDVLVRRSSIRGAAA